MTKRFNGELKVTQPEEKSDLETRVEALEKEVYKASKSENKDKKKSGPAEIRTQDLRRVKAGKCDICTVIDEPNTVDLSFSLNEESNHQNTVS